MPSGQPLRRRNDTGVWLTDDDLDTLEGSPMDAEIIEQAGGRPVHVWIDGGGQKWACVCYDHGPFCRLCQRVDETLDALLDNVRVGRLLARAKADGEFEFKVTQKGVVAAEDLIGTDPEIALLWGQAQRQMDEGQS